MGAAYPRGYAVNHPRGRGGTGRRAGFRSRWASALGGSIPSARITCVLRIEDERLTSAAHGEPVNSPEPTGGHDQMRKILTLTALALVVAVLVPVAAMADDTATIQADIAKLQADVKVKHDTVMADAQALENDAKSLVGSDKATAKAKIKADILKLNVDWHSLVAVCLAD